MTTEIITQLPEPHINPHSLTRDYIYRLTSDDISRQALVDDARERSGSKGPVDIIGVYSMLTDGGMVYFAVVEVCV